MEEKFIQGFSEIISLHNDFAASVKLVEHFIHSIDNTTLNDSRYALRAVVDCVDAAIKSHDSNFEKAHAVAMTALRIAWHDIVDIMHDEFKIYLDELAKRYGPDVVDGYIDIKNCRKCIRKIQDLITESRGDREKRIELYKQISFDDLEAMLELYRECQDSEPAIARKVSKEKSTRRISYAAIVISVISVCTIVYTNFFKADPAEISASTPTQTSIVESKPSS